MGQAEGLLFGILASHSCTKKCNASEACNYKDLFKLKADYFMPRNKGNQNLL